MILNRFTQSVLMAMTIVMVGSTMVRAQISVPELYESSFEAEISGNFAKALNKMLEIVRADTQNYTATLRSGWLFHRNRKDKLSVKYYQKANTLRPEAIEPLLGMSLPLMGLKQWGNAEGVLKDIIKKDPNNYLASSRLAYVLFSQGKYGVAKTAYLNLLQLYPSDIDMKLGLAWTYVRMGDKKRASVWFNDVLRVRRTNLSALEGMDVVRQM